uniref:PDZ domain-containing protein n=1 Tax=Zooxanthella nutricula TaxID=1333877 RepID=A0A7S2NAT9_9DINO
MGMHSTPVQSAEAIAPRRARLFPARPRRPAPPLRTPAPAAGAAASRRRYDVTLDRAGGNALGLDLEYTQSDDAHVPIDRIKPGLATEWNKACPPGRVIRRGDVIVAVNGATSMGAMYDKLRHEQVLHLTLEPKR